MEFVRKSYKSAKKKESWQKPQNNENMEKNLGGILMLLSRFIKNVLVLTGQVFLSFIIIMLISASPTLFNGMKINLIEYVTYFSVLLDKVLHFNNGTFWEKGPLFPLVLEKAWDTYYLLFLSFISAMIAAVIITYIGILLMKKKLYYIERVLHYVEALPDILIISGLQFCILYFYKKTDILVAKVVTVGESKSILLPVICLGIPASIYFIKIFLRVIEKEWSKTYTVLGRSIGATPFHILTFHISRNVFHEVFISTRTLVWSMLTTLVIIEYLFNYQGLLWFLITFRDPEVFFVSSVIMFIPFLVIYKSYHFFVPDIIKGEKSS